MSHLFCFGLGYSASVLARELLVENWLVSGTSRDPGRGSASPGVRQLAFDGSAALPADVFDGVNALLISIPPGADGDPVLRHHAETLAACAGQFDWIGYLSSTSVYGDRAGGWVDETSAADGSSTRGVQRRAAEDAWLSLWQRHALPVHVFRLAGIYGPGRNQLDRVAAGRAARIVKPGHFFSRIHVEDIAGVLRASMARPNPGAIYNVADDEPAPPQDVVAFAAALLGVTPPPELAIEDADMSPAARAFYADSKRIDNTRLHRELGYTLRYPDYRAGLSALAAAGKR
ncbi:MAG: SDR family oxidoreductase [Gammaproteobacteria bacterium]|nr:SDR family oxidoreductase [Gammaproteobacteria bacterium]